MGKVVGFRRIGMDVGNLTFEVWGKLAFIAMDKVDANKAHELSPQAFATAALNVVVFMLESSGYSPGGVRQFMTEHAEAAYQDMLEHPAFGEEED